MTMPCAYDNAGPDGFDCERDATCRVHSGEYHPDRAHYSAWSCDEHRDYFRGEVYRVTRFTAIVAEGVPA